MADMLSDGETIPNFLLGLATQRIALGRAVWASSEHMYTPALQYIIRHSRYQDGLNSKYL